MANVAIGQDIKVLRVVCTDPTPMELFADPMACVCRRTRSETKGVLEQATRDSKLFVLLYCIYCITLSLHTNLNNASAYH